jgi:hypothetical protein
MTKTDSEEEDTLVGPIAFLLLFLLLFLLTFIVFAAVLA